MYAPHALCTADRSEPQSLSTQEEHAAAPGPVEPVAPWQVGYEPPPEPLLLLLHAETMAAATTSAPESNLETLMRSSFLLLQMLPQSRRGRRRNVPREILRNAIAEGVSRCRRRSPLSSEEARSRGHRESGTPRSPTQLADGPDNDVE